jgi:outer membrane receptor protein involved in Fe transport
VSGAIGTLNPSDIVDRCVDLPSIDNVFCGLIHRDPATSKIVRIDNTQINLGAVEVSGIDVEILYGFDLSRVAGSLPGRLDIDLIATHLDKQDTTPDATRPNQVIEDAGEFGRPKWRANASLTYRVNDFSVNWFVNYIQSTKAENQPATPELFPEGYDRIPGVIYHNLAATYKVTDGLSFRLAINNLLDKAPPTHPYVTVPLAYYSEDRSQIYDKNGRVYVAGVTARF